MRKPSHSIIHFAISHRPPRGSISSYNIVGLISEVSEEVATQIAKNCRGQQHQVLSFEAPAKRNPLYFQKPESLAYIFVAACMGLSSFKFVQLAPKYASFLHQRAQECVLVVQGHPRSMILVPIESTYTTSY